jgi:SAM-dependent methyltransferase
MSDGRDLRSLTNCCVCGANALRESDAYRGLPRVTSDCKPLPAGGRIAACLACGAVQKIADDRWFQEIETIYGNYEIYHQSAGAEQCVFDSSGGAIPRSRRLIASLGTALGTQQRGRLLDFGCGNGAMLAGFAVEWPDWDLYGSDLSDKAIARLQAIPRFKELFVGPIETIRVHFDLITLIHSLEHLPQPLEMLRQLGSLLEGSGRLFVQVPDAVQNPYDFLVADHLMHFTGDTLGLLSQLAGYETHLLSDRVLVKELSWIGSPKKEAPNGRGDIVRPDIGAALVERNVKWLAEQLSSASTISRDSRNFGIFGTSISATWLAGAVPGRVAFFVDEDPTRVGRTHLGVPVRHPTEVMDADVFVPLIPDVAKRIVEKFGAEHGCYHVPPDLVAPV